LFIGQLLGLYEIPKLEGDVSYECRVFVGHAVDDSEENHIWLLIVVLDFDGLGLGLNVVVNAELNSPLHVYIAVLYNVSFLIRENVFA
jgi:hypothetical protein